MSGINHKFAAAAALLLFWAGVTRAQDGAYASYTPYSIFGVGDILGQGSAYNGTMGGVGIASRNHRYLNFLNPAAVTARDSLAFMVDFSISQGNKIFRQGDMRSAVNTFTVNDCAMSFPLWKKTAMSVGIRPYSSIGYSYGYVYDDPALLGTVGNVAFSASGQGALYEVFSGIGVEPVKNLSLGVEGIYYFGSMEKKNYETFSDASYNGATNGYRLKLNAATAKFGLQYEARIDKENVLCAGATYKLGTDLGGHVESYEFSTGTAASDTLSYKMDTLRNNPGRVKLAGELGVGIAFSHADRWRVELDYTRSDWTQTGMDTFPGFAGNSSPSATRSSFSAAVAQTLRAGFEIVPNRNDIRYYHKKMAYRAGAYYRTEYYKIDGHTINDIGITLGATLPVFRWYNGITLGMEVGQRGMVRDNLIRERYVNFKVGVNLFDIWFQKPRYE